MTTFTVEGKTYTKLANLAPWKKNPKFIKDENFEKLKRQITELGLYKPLVVTGDGTILGGNQRYKALKELNVEDVWVSVVDAWDDTTMLKYALSDNLSLGTYKKDELYELVKPIAGQKSLLPDYDIEINDPQTIQEFVDEFALGEDALLLKQVRSQLEQAGINKETIELIEQMSKYHKNGNKLEEIDIKGDCVKSEKYPLTFWFQDKTIQESLFKIFSINGTQKLDEQLLIKAFIK